MINRRRFLTVIFLLPLSFILNDFFSSNKILKSRIAKSKNLYWILSENDN